MRLKWRITNITTKTKIREPHQKITTFIALKKEVGGKLFRHTSHQ